MSEKEKDETEKSSIINFKTFQVIIGIIIASGSFYFTVVKYIQSQPSIDVYVNSIDISFHGDTVNNELIYELRSIEDDYIDITGMWILDMIEFFDSTKTTPSPSTIIQKINEIEIYYGELSKIISTDLIFEEDFAYLGTDDFVEIYLDEMYFDYSDRFDSVTAQILFENDFNLELLPPNIAEQIVELSEEYLENQISGMLSRLNLLQQNIGLYFDLDKSTVDISVTLVNSSNNANAILPNYYMVIANEFADPNNEEEYFKIKMRMKNLVKIEEYSIYSFSSQSQPLFEILNDISKKNNSIENADADELLRSRIVKFFEIVAMDGNEESNFKVGMRDIHSNIWWYSGNINNVGEAENERLFMEDAFSSMQLFKW